MSMSHVPYRDNHENPEASGLGILCMVISVLGMCDCGLLFLYDFILDADKLATARTANNVNTCFKVA